MEIDIPLEALVRAGSGILWIALGVASIVFVRRHAGTATARRGARTFGALAIAFGWTFLCTNILNRFPGMVDVAFFLAAVGWSTVAACALRLAHLGFPGDLRPSKVGIGVAYALAVIAFASWIRYNATSANPFPVRIFGGSVTLGLTALAGWAVAASTTMGDRSTPRAALASVGVALFGGVYAGRTAQFLAPPGTLLFVNTLVFGPILLATLAAGVAWLVASSRGAGRPARWASWALLAGLLAGMIEGAIAPNADSVFVGVVRSIAALIVAIAILRHDLLGVPLPDGAVGRGTLAMVSLAGLFIVAEIAQTYIASRYSLLMGGAVAGALLFTAAPIQRALEDRGSMRPGAHDEVYKNAIRLALRDRVLTREEEAHLFRLAESLGIGAGRAHELYAEVERESRTRQ